MRKSTEEYLIERCRSLEEQVGQQEATIQLLAMQRDELQADNDCAEETIDKLLHLINPGIHVGEDPEGEKYRHMSLSVWEKYSRDKFNWLEALLKEHNMIEVEGWEEANA